MLDFYFKIGYSISPMKKEQPFLFETHNKKSLVNLSNSILKHFGVNPFHDTIPEIDECLKGHDKVVVVLFDGMGQNIVRKHLKEDSYIRSHYVTTINSTFPPTTAAATTAFLTGKYPIETGWLGWCEYFKDYDRNIILFTSTDYNTEEKLTKGDKESIANKYFPTQKIFELIEQNNKDVRAFNISRYPIQKDGPKVLLTKGVNKLKKVLSENDKCFVYFYWDSPDYEMHAYGIDNSHIKYQVNKAQRFIKKVTDDNPDTLFILIADHGHINVKFLDICDHQDLYSLLEKPMTLEKRTPSFFVKEDKKDEFVTLFNKYYGEHFLLFTKEEAFANKAFGEGEPAKGVEDVIGNFVATSIDEYSLYASKELPHMDFFKGHHAGATKEERLIDVSIFNK